LNGNKVVKKEDGLLYRATGESIDLGFVRKVKLIKKDIPTCWNIFYINMNKTIIILKM
jgi:hypothetical protein